MSDLQRTIFFVADTSGVVRGARQASEAFDALKKKVSEPLKVDLKLSAASLESEFKKIRESLSRSVTISADTSSAIRSVNAISEAVDALRRAVSSPIKIDTVLGKIPDLGGLKGAETKIEFDYSGAERGILHVKNLLDSVNSDIRVTFKAEAPEAFDAFRKKMSEPLKADIKFSVDGAEAEIIKVKELVSDLGSQKPIPITADASPALKELEKARGDIEALRKAASKPIKLNVLLGKLPEFKAYKTINAKIEANSAGAEKRIVSVKELLRSFNPDLKITVTADTAEALSSLKELNSEYKKLRDSFKKTTLVPKLDASAEGERVRKAITKSLNENLLIVPVKAEVQVPGAPIQSLLKNKDLLSGSSLRSPLSVPSVTPFSFDNRVPIELDLKGEEGVSKSIDKLKKPVNVKVDFSEEKSLAELDRTINRLESRKVSIPVYFRPDKQSLASLTDLLLTAKMGLGDIGAASGRRLDRDRFDFFRDQPPRDRNYSDRPHGDRPYRSEYERGGGGGSYTPRAEAPRKNMGKLGTVSERFATPMPDGFHQFLMFAGIHTAVQEMREFSAAMGQAQIAAEATAKDMEHIKQVILTTKGSLYTPVQQARAWEESLKAGLKMGEAELAVPVVLDFATLTDQSPASASNLLAQVKSNYKMDASEFPRIAEVITKGLNSSTSGAADFTEALKYVVPVAADLGMPLEEVTAALAKLADAGFKGSTGGTALRRVLLGLIAPTKANHELLQKYADDFKNDEELASMTKGFKALGVSMKDIDTTGDGLAKSMAALKKLGISQADLARIFGLQGAGPANVLMSTMNSRADLQKELAGSKGDLKTMMKPVSENFDAAYKRMRAAISDAIVSISEAGSGKGFVSVFDKITASMEFLVEHAKVASQAFDFLFNFVIAKGALAAAFAVGRFLKGMGSLTGLLMIGTVIYTMKDDVKLFGVIVDQVSEAAKRAFSWVASVLEGMMNLGGRMMGFIADFFGFASDMPAPEVKVKFDGSEVKAGVEEAKSSLGSLGDDTSKLSSANDNLKKTSKGAADSVREVGTSAAQSAPALSSAASSGERLADSASKAATDTGKAATAVGELGAKSGETKPKVDDLKKGTDDLEGSSKNLTGSVNDGSTALSNNQTQMGKSEGGIRSLLRFLNMLQTAFVNLTYWIRTGMTYLESFNNRLADKIPQWYGQASLSFTTLKNTAAAMLDISAGADPQTRLTKLEEENADAAMETKKQNEWYQGFNFDETKFKKDLADIKSEHESDLKSLKEALEQTDNDARNIVSKFSKPVEVYGPQVKFKYSDADKPVGNAKDDVENAAFQADRFKGTKYDFGTGKKSGGGSGGGGGADEPTFTDVINDLEKAKRAAGLYGDALAVNNAIEEASTRLKRKLTEAEELRVETLVMDTEILRDYTNLLQEVSRPQDEYTRRALALVQALNSGKISQERYNEELYKAEDAYRKAAYPFEYMITKMKEELDLLDQVSFARERQSRAVYDAEQSLGRPLNDNEKNQVIGMSDERDMRTGRRDMLRQFTEPQETYERTEKIAGGLRSQGKLNDNQYGDVMNEADTKRLNSTKTFGFGDSYIKQLKLMKNATKSDVSEIGKMFAETLGPGGKMIDGVSRTFAEAIVMGKDWKQSLKEVAATILTDMLQALIKMGLNMAMNALLGQSLQAGATAASVGQAAAVTAAWTPAAAVTSLATAGANSAPAATGMTTIFSLLAALIGGIGGMAGHATGGLITGPGTGTSDSIPAWLSNGEYVINAKAANANLPLLEMINGGKKVTPSLGGVLKFSRGGMVGPSTVHSFPTGGAAQVMRQGGSNVNVSIINNAPGVVVERQQGTSPEDIRMIVRAEMGRSMPSMMSNEIANPYSPASKQLRQTTTVRTRY